MNGTPHLRTPTRDLGCGDTRRRGLERVLTGLEGVRSTFVNPATRTAYKEIVPAHVDVNAVARAIDDGASGRGEPFSTAKSGL
jgi:hypothetical protein